MLKSHFEAVENSLLSSAKISGNAGHSLHKGSPREAFIREFLEKHLTELIGIGSGEVIDSRSVAKVVKNQIDIVLYNKGFPKLDFGANLKAFLVESVAATIEVKSTLDEDELIKSFNSIRNTKSLKSNLMGFSTRTGYIPPGIISIIVAFAGPAKMTTVKRWIDNYLLRNNLTVPIMRPDANERVQYSSPVADIIIVLGKGFINFDNNPISFITNEDRVKQPDASWIIIDNKTDNLFWLFLTLTTCLTGWERHFSLTPYLKNSSGHSLLFE